MGAGGLGTEAGWAIVVDRDGLALEEIAERYGAVYRVPLDPGEPLDQLAPGQRCVLFRTDRSRTVGIWAIGEVVAPALVLGDEDPLLPGEPGLCPTPEPPPRCYAEVELLLLEKPLARDRLAATPGLAGSRLVGDGPSPGLVPLAPDELRAIEALDFWLVEPDDRQRGRLDALLDAEDDLLP